jgi:hypothetical protein
MPPSKRWGIRLCKSRYNLTQSPHYGRPKYRVLHAHRHEAFSGPRFRPSGLAQIRWGNRPVQLVDS